MELSWESGFRTKGSRVFSVQGLKVGFGGVVGLRTSRFRFDIGNGLP